MSGRGGVRHFQLPDDVRYASLLSRKPYRERDLCEVEEGDNAELEPWGREPPHRAWKEMRI